MPETVSAADRLTPPVVLLTVRLLNVVEAEPPMVWAPVPFNVTVLPVLVMVPPARLFVKFPATPIAAPRAFAPAAPLSVRLP